MWRAFSIWGVRVRTGYTKTQFIMKIMNSLFDFHMFAHLLFLVVIFLICYLSLVKFVSLLCVGFEE